MAPVRCDLLQAGNGFCIAELIARSLNAAPQKIAHDRLADEARAARYQKFRTFASLESPA